MKRYNVGKGYLVLTDAAKYMANKIGKPKDEKIIGKIYKEFRNRINENNFEYERFGKRIIKVKKKYLDSLVEEFKNIAIEYTQLEYILEDRMNDSIESQYFINDGDNNLSKEGKNEVVTIDNLNIIKDLLVGKYDNMIDIETKIKLIQRLMDDK